jgi:hypothetical protein
METTMRRPMAALRGRDVDMLRFWGEVEGTRDWRWEGVEMRKETKQNGLLLASEIITYPLLCMVRFVARISAELMSDGDRRPPVRTSADWGPKAAVLC